MASAVPSQTPQRYPTGVATDQKWQPLAEYGNRNPFLYHEWEDDFDNSLAVASAYTATKTGVGTIAHTAGDGGLILFTTAASASALCSIQLPAASFTVTAGKKMFYETRLQISDATNCLFVCGLQNTNTTPFTTPTDGIYFSKVGGATSLNLLMVNASTVTTLAIPTSAYTLTANTNIDLAFRVDRSGNVYAFVGAQLVGWIPQSLYDSITMVRGPVATAAPALSTANLNLTMALQTGNSTAVTMTADFHMMAKER